MSDQTTIPEGFADLLEAPFTTIATLGKRPRTSDAIRREPVRLDPQNPMRYLEVRGDAQFADDADYAFAESLGRKYRGMRLPTRVVAIDLDPCERIPTISLD